MCRFPLVHAFFAALIDNALGVAKDDIVRVEAHRLDEFNAGDARRTRAIADEFRRLHVAARQVKRVDETGGGDDRRTVLVVVKHRDVHQFAQALLDDETVRRLDVFQIDAAERRAEIAHGIDEGVDIGRIDFKVDGVHIREALEQHRLAFHHRLGGQRAEIAEAEDCRAIGNDGDQIALGRVIIGQRRVFRDGLHRHGDAWRIGKREVALRGHGLGGVDLQLAGTTLRVKVERFLLTGCGCAF